MVRLLILIWKNTLLDDLFGGFILGFTQGEGPVFSYKRRFINGVYTLRQACLKRDTFRYFRNNTDGLFHFVGKFSRIGRFIDH